MNKEFKKEVLAAFQKVSPSKIEIESKDEFAKYKQNQFSLFFHKLKFPPELFCGKKVIDFGCGTGEMDVVLANWGAIRKSLKDVEYGVSALVGELSDHIKRHLVDLNFNLLGVLEKIVLKARKDGEFDLNQSDTKLFRGYNGLGTNYVVFHKPS